MVKRAEFEKELMKILVPAIGHAQDVLLEKYGVRFSVQVDWELGKNYHFEDETPTKGGIGG
jgi:hypothetical protein